MQKPVWFSFKKCSALQPFGGRVIAREIMAAVRVATAALAMTVWFAQAQAPELPPGHTAQDIIVPMANNAPNTAFTVIRDEQWSVVNTPLAIKNADGTYTLLDGRPCPPGRTERACNTANKIVLQNIIEWQETIPDQQNRIKYLNQFVITGMAFEELQVPWSIDRALLNPKFTIKSEDIPKLKNYQAGVYLLNELVMNIPYWEKSLKNLDRLRNTNNATEEIKTAKDAYIKYAKLAWLRPQEIISVK